MDLDEYIKALRRLGISGPTGESRQADNGALLNIYTMPDGARKYLVPADRMTDEQRSETIAALQLHLGTVEAARKNGDHDEH